MSQPYFSKELIRAVNDWQTGSVGKKKKAEAIAKAIAAAPLDSYLTSCDDVCYRRSVLEKNVVSDLFFTFKISEETSSWTTKSSVAARFKGGPPDPPKPGVIFAHRPLAGEVVLNLERLIAHPQFQPSVKYWKALGLNVASGIERWGNTQHEVVLLVDHVTHDEIHAFGSNSATSAIEQALGTTVIGTTALSSEDVARTFEGFGVLTKRWIFGEGVEHIYRNWIDKVLGRLRP